MVRRLANFLSINGYVNFTLQKEIDVDTSNKGVYTQVGATPGGEEEKQRRGKTNGLSAPASRERTSRSPQRPPPMATPRPGRAGSAQGGVAAPPEAPRGTAESDAA